MSLMYLGPFIVVILELSGLFSTGFGMVYYFCIGAFLYCLLLYNKTMSVLQNKI